MNDLAERSVTWQERNVTPILLAVALIAVLAATVAGGVPIWLGLPIALLVGWALVQVIKQRRQSNV